MKNHCSKFLAIAVLGAVILGIMSQTASAGLRGTTPPPPPPPTPAPVVSNL